MPLLRVHNRWFIHKDLESVLEIEQASFDHPWTERDFRAVFRIRETMGHVAEPNDSRCRVAGFMITELKKRRIDLINLAVAPDCRRMGVGQQMLGHLIGKLHPGQRTAITAVVRESNLGGQLFFRDTGFVAVRVLRGYYQDDGDGEDGYLMEYRIQAARSEEELIEECEGR